MSSLTRLARSFFSTTSTARRSAKPKFIVYAPDSVDPGTLDKRYEVRPRHFERITPLIKSGVVQVAGMIIDPAHAIVDVGQNKAIGSLLIIQAENIEEARKIIEDDIYAQSGVWDREKLVIAPFIAATPFPA